jgi:uroporphyrinogen decarboxylase
MKKIERVRAALQREALQRPPFSFWTHMPGIDLDPVRLADETAAFQARYDIDFVKAMPNGLYCVEDWGVECDYSGIARGGTANVVRAAISAIDDWVRIERVSVLAGAYGRELEHLARLVGLVGAQVPVLATVFSPMTIAAKLSEGLHRKHLAESPAEVIAALDVITAVTCEFVRQALDRGCAGVFFATQDATRKAFSAADYRLFAEPFDRVVLKAAADAGGWFNVLHAHGEDILFDILKDYEVSALNWHIGETPPSIKTYRDRGGARPIVGGLQRAHLTRCDREAVSNDIERALKESGARGILLAPACVIRHPLDAAMLEWTAQAIRAGR